MLVFSGSAEVVHASLSLLRAPLLTLDLSNTGPLASAGGFLQTSLLTLSPSISPLFLSAEVADALASGQGLQTDAWSSTASVSVGLQTAALLPPQLSVSADVIQANASATCPNANPASGGTANYAVTVSGSALLANLKISAAGLPVKVSPNPGPNTVIAIPGVATIVLNEQVSSVSSTSTSGTGNITVNAIHITLDPALAAIAGGDIVISDAKAGITCTAPPPPTSPPPPPINCPVSDFVTYGGYIAGPNGGKANFGGVGGYKPNSSTTPTGHLNYVDHGVGGPHVKGSTVTSYSAMSATIRQLKYGCDASTKGCTVTVDDQGEPGSSDSFGISYPGYNAQGLLGGGNVQLHKPAGCP
jgi:hypothetical protein